LCERKEESTVTRTAKGVVTPTVVRRAAELVALTATIATAVTIAVAGCATARAPGVDVACLERDIRFLSDDALGGRGLGSMGIEAAAAYQEAAFRALGLEPFDGRSYRQEIKLQMSTPDPKAAVVFDGGEERFAPALGQDTVVVTQNQSAPAEVEAQVVYGGYFIDAPEVPWDDVKGEDLRGKALVVEVNEPDSREGGLFDGTDMTWHGRWVRKFELAARAGAVGILIIHNDVGAGYGWPVVNAGWTREQFFIQGAPTASLGFMGWLSNAAGERVLALAGADAAALRAQAQSRDFRPVHLPLTVRVRQAPQFRTIRTDNVAGLLRSNDPRAAGRYVVVSAHYDHMGTVSVGQGEDGVFNGAVDNCSASASMIKVARILSQATDTLAVNVFFLAATAEEEGLLGSDWFVRNLPVPKEQVLGNVNFEMTNVWGKTKDVYAIAARHSDMEEIVGQAARNLGLEAISERDGEKGYFFRSDQLSFIRHGIPGVWLHEGVTSDESSRHDVSAKRREYEQLHYHHVTDEVNDDWDLRGTAQMVEWAIETIHVIGDREVRPAFHEGSPFHAPNLNDEPASGTE